MNPQSCTRDDVNSAEEFSLKTESSSSQIAFGSQTVFYKIAARLLALRPRLTAGLPLSGAIGSKQQLLLG